MPARLPATLPSPRRLSLHVVRRDDRRVVAPALGVRRGAVDDATRGCGRQLGGRDLVVDAPPGVVVEGLAAPRPPRVRPGSFAAEAAAEADPVGVEQTGP